MIEKAENGEEGGEDNEEEPRVPRHLDQVPDKFKPDMVTADKQDSPAQISGLDVQYKGTPPMERKIPSRTKRKAKQEVVSCFTYMIFQL